VKPPESTIGWLLEGDPAVAWQTRRDLLGAPESEWRPIRSRIADEGWGRRLLDAQDQDGKWGGGLYQPKWTSTTYTLLQLRRLGLDPSDPAAIAGARCLLDEADWVEGGVSYWSGRLLAERCVNGMVLSIVSYFDVDDDRIPGMAEMLGDSRVTDGGWNCRDYQGDTHHSSFNTTISVLEGLLLWKRRTGSDMADDSIASGQGVLLDHRMFRAHTTGEVINENWSRFSFPPRWHYDILRGLDHLRDAGTTPDPRAAEAIEVVLSRQRSDGRWPIGPRYSGEFHFRMETGRNPGRWNTLRASRVLDWWEGRP
jgi:hypothetical protein